MQFERWTQEARFYSPLEDFEEVAIEVEVREDPLTGRRARVVPESFLQPEGEPNIDPVVGDSEGCFFCPDSVADVTPEYPDWVGADRGRVGEATSFPNLNPYGAYSNVVALTEDHFRPIDEFTPEIFANGLRAAIEYVTGVFEHDGDTEFASVNMNFLRPAGSSLVHPHVQTLVDDRGTNYQSQLTSAARKYYKAEGTSHWSALLDAERDGDRYVGATGDVEWVAAFAPRHHRHVTGVATDVAVPAPDDDVLDDFAEGLVGVLDAYAEAGLNSFNFAMHVVDNPAVPPVVDVIARSVFDEYYWSDSPFFTVLHDEGVVDVAPEEYAAETARHL